MATKRVMISIDERLLDRVDRAAHRAGTTRSGYFAQLADARRHGAEGPGAHPVVHAALKAIDALLSEGRKS